MEVDETPVLELDHLHVGEPGDRPQFGGAEPAGDGDQASEAVAGALPQARHVRVPQHRPPVVEALGAQRVAEDDGPGLVA